MNDAVMDMLMDRISRSDSRRDGRMSRRSRSDYRDGRDYRDGYEDGYSDAFDEFEGDSRKVDGHRHRRRSEHESPLRLSKEDLREWKRKLENNDGTKGPHYEMSQIMSAADKLGVKFDDFTEMEFCMTVNMFYSDYCDVAKKYVSHDKMLEYFVDMAYGFLHDIDGPEPWTKLMLYYHCIVNG